MCFITTKNPFILFDIGLCFHSFNVMAVLNICRFNDVSGCFLQQS